jgi:quercetin dioxygenase-like cupin family protein
MRTWNLREIEAPGGSLSPAVLASVDGAARAVLVALEPGQSLDQHQVKEHAFVLFVEGAAQVEAGGETVEAQPGTLVAFDPDERHAVRSAEGARLLLFLAPWPGEGHFRGDEDVAV